MGNIEFVSGGSGTAYTLHKFPCPGHSNNSGLSPAIGDECRVTNHPLYRRSQLNCKPAKSHDWKKPPKGASMNCCKSPGSYTTMEKVGKNLGSRRCPPFTSAEASHSHDIGVGGCVRCPSFILVGLTSKLCIMGEILLDDLLSPRPIHDRWLTSKVLLLCSAADTDMH